MVSSGLVMVVSSWCGPGSIRLTGLGQSEPSRGAAHRPLMESTSQLGLPACRSCLPQAGIVKKGERKGAPAAPLG